MGSASVFAIAREKMIVHQRQLLGSRLASLAMLSASLTSAETSPALHRYARAALAAGCKAPDTPWNKWDHAGLLQAEAQRGIAIARSLARWQTEFGDDRSPEGAFAQLARALGVQAQGTSLHLVSAAPLTALLDAAPGELPSADATAWLAWLLWWNAPVQLQLAAGENTGGPSSGWTLQAPGASAAEAAPPHNWLERMIEEMAEI